MFDLLESIEYSIFPDLFHKCAVFGKDGYYNYLFAALEYPNMIVVVTIFALCVEGMLRPFNKTDEYEADAIGMDLMKKAVYNPTAALWFEEFCLAQFQYPKEGTWLEKVSNFFSTHPLPRNRLEENRKTLKNMETS